MRKFFFLGLAMCYLFTPLHGQEMRLQKGKVMDSLPLRDTVGSKLSLYIPMNFERERNWPLLFICTTEGDTPQTMRYFQQASEANGFILASSSAIGDSIPLTEKVLYFGESLKLLDGLLPLNPQQIYVGGYGGGAQFASLLPNMVRSVRGVLSVASSPPNMDLVRSGSSFHYVAVLGRADYRYPEMEDAREFLESKRIPNQMLYHEEGAQWPEPALLTRAVSMLRLMGMSGGQIPRDTAFIREQYDYFLEAAREFRSRGDFILAYNRVESQEVFDGLTSTEEMRDLERELRRDNGYRTQRRAASNNHFREQILQADYDFYLEEDVLSFNLDNLGWWRYQMETITEYKESPKPEDQLLGRRLEGYINALVDDYIQIARTGEQADEAALVLLYMLKTITKPDDAENYLKVISLTSKFNDFGTSLFYLEELLKKGYSDQERLYSLEHTGLLRISPEFNSLIAKYLKESRYEAPPPPPEDGGLR